MPPITTNKSPSYNNNPPYSPPGKLSEKKEEKEGKNPLPSYFPGVSLPFSSLTINEPKPYDCKFYTHASNIETLPFFYQESELVEYYNTPPKVVTDKDTKIKTMQIIDAIHVNYIELAEEAKQSFIDDITSKEQDKNYADFQDFFYNNVKIYTKSEIKTKLIKGFEWANALIQTLWEQNIVRNGKDELKGTKPQWVLLTEMYVTVINNSNFRNLRIVPFKSSEWVGRMFIDWSSKKSICSCIMESNFLNIGDNSIIEDDLHEIYVLFDDGAYSGHQKASIIKKFLETMIPYRKHTELVMVIPYYTEVAIDRFRQYILTYIDQYKIETNTNIELTCTIEPSNQHHYKIISKLKGHIVDIYIWIGGVQMEDCESIIQSYPSSSSVEKETYKNMLSRYCCGLGATLTLFEHKVPDSLSLDARFGNSFRDKLKNHYTYNPPYKLKQIPITGGSRRKNTNTNNTEKSA